MLYDTPVLVLSVLNLSLFFILNFVMIFLSVSSLRNIIETVSLFISSSSAQAHYFEEKK